MHRKVLLGLVSLHGKNLLNIRERLGLDISDVRTVVIQNTPQAFRAFGVKNIPEHIIQSWARYRRRSGASASTQQPGRQQDLEDLEDLEDQVFN